MAGQLITKLLFLADPSARVFNNTLWLYTSHDINDTTRDYGYPMVDYHPFSTTSLDPYVQATDHGVALTLKDVPWAKQQMWAPDAAYHNGKYLFYFPAKALDNRFQIGVASSKNPGGPFIPNKQPIKGSFSIDPCVLTDDDGSGYMVFGGIWGGQLQAYQNHDTYDPRWEGAFQPNGTGVKALGPRIAKLDNTFEEFGGAIREITILDPDTKEPLMADDHKRRFFEGAFLHKNNGIYYLSYSTGDTHLMVYAMSKNVWGPYTYAGKLLDPLEGWTTHGSITKFKGEWYLFFADSSQTGVDALRSTKFRKIYYDSKGFLTFNKQ
ncbi:related to alpha-N-arabinofuranosidase / alpha-L-arabinofuranosidase [Rhynchosporium agropyri]|uniref:Related to alpha-N-arabinofuranosidase / alpha-L-arabinofuranosidase n=2 Tax=Rhynchosporium TaxID=38037 RepID=A0A1E1LFK4_9HELO|nr:related to alpha-N-arabinofuranosidase / alpha-L-arabinofuranosidase [Rhynchosporium commune]CZT09321.1 related to alpha-N-arabinofuranosidase / alpha-L-arabinofuranosidase [Rhynchosporium agropyri]